MSFLPIVERELREGARRASAYWLRTIAAAVGIGVGAMIPFAGRMPSSGSNYGPVVFWALAASSLVFCMLAGRILTADCISREKRDGTLGLLFLTDLKGYDVVLGKLVATSMTALTAVVAIIPMLTVPLLLGGVTQGEVWRTAAALINTFFFSLAVGLLASAISREYRLAMAANFLIFVVLTFAPAAVGMAVLFVTDGNFVDIWFYGCPIYTLVRGAEVLYRRASWDFWFSIALINFLGWVLVAAACWVVPKSWRDKAEGISPGSQPRWRWVNLKRWVNFGDPAKQNGFRQWALNQNAYFWLAARARLKPVQVWMFLATAAVWWLDGWRRAGAMWLGPDFYLPILVLLNLTLKFWVAQEAVQRLGEDRASGAFELLLPTPLTTEDFLGGELLAMRRQFLKAILVVFALELCFVFVVPMHHRAAQVPSLIAEVVFLPLDAMALIWVGMYAGMVTSTPTRAIIFAIGRVLLPAAACYQIASQWERDRIAPWLGTSMWIAVGLAADAGFGWYSWRSLRTKFRELAMQSPMFRHRVA